MARMRNSSEIYLLAIAALIMISRASEIPKITLSCGNEIPVVGLGTWQMKSNEVDDALTAALENGYSHIDTAFIYQNEEAIGQSLKKWFDKGGKRENLFITTKLPFFGNRASDVELYLQLSLERLGLQYVDLYLIHDAFGTLKDSNEHGPAVNEDGSLVLDPSTDHTAIWKAMEAQVKAGKTKAIGVCNFNETQLLNIIDIAEIKPSNLQIEIQVYNQQRPLRELCAKHNISVTAYSTLGSPGSDPDIKTEYSLKFPQLFQHPTVQKIAEMHKKSSAQVLLRHAVQGGLIVIPKSTHSERIKANIEIFNFSLSDDEMKELNDLDKGEDGRLFDWSIFKGVEKHPEYPFRRSMKEV